MGSRIKKLLILLIMVLGVVLFASEEKKAPNEIVKDNPEREVTTVESMKVRDHATMSLSVTKSIPEEIMGSLSEDGKLSVFIYKKQPRMMARSAVNKSVGSNIGNLKLKAYSKRNKPIMLRSMSYSSTPKMSEDLTAEDIRNMMNSDEASKEKKINVVEETDEYVRLEVEDVAENEKVYISVMDGENIVKSYRIGEIRATQTRINCDGYPSSANYSKNAIIVVEQVDSTNGGYAFNEGVKQDGIGNFKITKVGYINQGTASFDRNNNGNISLRMQDDYISNFTISGSVEMALKVENKDLTGSYDKYNINIGKGDIKIIVEDIIKEPSDESEKNFVSWIKSKLLTANLSYLNSVWFPSFRNLVDEYRTYSCTFSNTSTFKRNIEQVGIRAWINPGSRIGVYEKKAYGWKIGKNNYAISGYQDIQLALKDSGATFSKSFPAGIGTIINLSSEIGSDTYNNYSLSFMKKTNVSDRGLFRANGNKLSNGTSFEIYGTTSTNKIRVTVNQTDGKYITLKLEALQLNSTDTFSFTLQQKFNNRILRAVTYKITLEKTNQLGSLNYNIDSRIEGTNGEWIDKSGNVKNKTGVIQSSLPEMVGAWIDNKNTNVENKTITDIMNINGKMNGELGNDVSKAYKYIINDGKNKLALPYNVQGNKYTSNSILVNKEDLDTMNNGGSKVNSFILKDRSNTYWSGTMTENYIGNKNPNSSSGSIDLSDVPVNVEYSFATSGTNPTSNGNGSNPQITLTTNSPLDASGRLTKNNNQNIATKIVVTENGQRKEIMRTGRGAGEKIEPQNIDFLSNKVAIGINTNGGLIIKRTSDNGFGEAESNSSRTVKIEYFYGGGTGNEVKLGEFNLTITMIERIKDKIDINITIDPRVVYTANSTDTTGSVSWVTLDKKFGKWNDGDKENLSEMINVNQVYNDTTLTVSSVASVKGETKETSSSDYERFRKEGAANDRLDIAFKKGVTFTALSENSNLMISPIRAVGYETIYVASDNKKYRSTITMSHAVKPNDSYFKEDIGYDGDGRIDLSGKDPKEYTLLHPSLSGEINDTKITLDYHDGYLPTFNGLINGETNNQIVTKYRVKVGTNTFGNFTNVNEEININNNISITLSKTTGVNDKKNIKINKKTDETFNYTLLIEYYCKNVKLGEYTLEVTNTNRPKDLGVAQIDLDARISQVNDNSSWIRLSDKTLFHLTNQSSIGQYTEFIKVASSFSNAGTLSDYDSGTIASIENINGSSTLYDTIKGTTTYTYLSSENEAAFPKGITFGEFKKTGVESKLIISKYDVKNSNHNGNNNFSIKLGNGIRFTGNIMENYKGQDGNNINLPIVNPENTIFKGKGKLNLVKSTVGTTYSFDAGQSGNISGNGDTNVVLKITEGKSLDATGVLPSNTNQSIANRMVIQYGDNIIATVNGNVGDKLESGDLTIDEAKIKIGINSNGELIMTKVEDGNITSSMLAIDYYYINKTNTNVQNDIHLGRFELTLMNPIIESSTTPTVTIDKRFAENVHYNWLFRDGRASNDLYKYPENAQNYEVLFKYNGDLFSTNGEIRDAIGMEGRIHRTNSSDTKGYRLYHINDTEWRGEAAVPIVGSMNDLNNIITISKGNREDFISKENKFSLLFEEDGEMKVYKGNIKEDIVGDGVSRGSGEVTFMSDDTDITYEFPTTFNNGEGIVNGIDNNGNILEMKNMKISTGATQALPNGNGLTEIVGKNQVIANKITVTVNSVTSSNNTKEVTVDNVTFGIGDNGGLTLKKGSNFNPSEDKVYTIKFYYKSPNNDTDGDVELSSFDLTIRKSIFEIDGDGVLNFGDMVYDSSYPYVTQGGIFYVKCNDPAMIEGKKVEFSVDRDKVQPMKNTNGQTGDQNEVPLVNTQVQTRSNGKFYLQSTADLSGRPNTGKYEGEIEVIVTIQDKQP